MTVTQIPVATLGKMHDRIAALEATERTLAALAEPTPEMIWAGNSLMACAGTTAAAVWRVMYAAATSQMCSRKDGQ